MVKKLYFLPILLVLCSLVLTAAVFICYRNSQLSYTGEKVDLIFATQSNTAHNPDNTEIGYPQQANFRVLEVIHLGHRYSRPRMNIGDRSVILFFEDDILKGWLDCNEPEYNARVLREEYHTNNLRNLLQEYIQQVSEIT